ncbi:hypothetical protein FisN_21Hu180 [Fistulifera solaris]|jgi:hypothetical protein|uniref:Uncharacterized protein n=1 Tax=Fistulifera solaris TaxID=1519565 RepID=A0A1Z5JRU1_FISSO|nr:hypothetical protein FisN_21Hu180 [Fistulifera solaris]|eukprot:GAX16737.1 hypothetical protein FisN_21Hu180 [Fistulifera solaris]
MLEKVKATIGKALSVNSKPTEETFSELPDVLIWFRAVLGLTYGIFMGLKGIRSGPALVQAVNLIVFIPFMYSRFYLGVEMDHFASQIYFSGTFNALALFLLIWICLYTAEHEEDENQLAALLVSSSKVGDLRPDAAVPLMEAVAEESEF